MTRIALVTGGEQGIGLGIVEALVKSGYQVAISSERSETDPEVTRALQTFESAVQFFQHDLRNIDGIDGFLAKITTDLGAISAFISNAGIASPIRGDLLDLTPENFDRVLDINLRGAFFLAQGVARHMLDNVADYYRSITFVTSVSAEMVSIERADYCISKSAASMMARNFAVRLAPHAIGVFELRPGIIATPMTNAVKDKYTPKIKAGLVPSGRWGKPSDVGSVIPPLVSGQMAFATGSVLAVDGGLSIPRL